MESSTTTLPDEAIATPEEDFALPKRACSIDNPECESCQ